MTDKVFIALQDSDDARPIIEAIEQDNPDAEVQRMPGMVRIKCPGSMVINRETVTEHVGRDWDVQELQLSLISLGGNIYEDDDKFELAWNTTA